MESLTLHEIVRLVFLFGLGFHLLRGDTLAKVVGVAAIILGVFNLIGA